MAKMSHCLWKLFSNLNTIMHFCHLKYIIQTYLASLFKLDLFWSLWENTSHHCYHFTHLNILICCLNQTNFLSLHYPKWYTLTPWNFWTFEMQLVQTEVYFNFIILYCEDLYIKWTYAVSLIISWVHVEMLTFWIYRVKKVHCWNSFHLFFQCG